MSIRKKCKYEILFILAEILNMCLKESYLLDFWKVSSKVPIFRIVEEREFFGPVSLLSVVGKVFKKLVNNRFFDHLKKCCLLHDFQHGFESSRSIVF